jgi:hypothetical protein
MVPLVLLMLPLAMLLPLVMLVQNPLVMLPLNPLVVMKEVKPSLNKWYSIATYYSLTSSTLT